jgi:maltose 6'-phosphate phosphatase
MMEMKEEIMTCLVNPKRVGLIAAMMFFLYVPAARAVQQTCPDISGRNYINVLTVNLLFSEIENRDLRLTRIAEFVDQETRSGNPIDVIFLQEVVGGFLAQTDNSSIDLLSLLAAKSLRYNLRFKMINGVSGLLSVGDAILTRCAVKSALAVTLPRRLPTTYVSASKR